jgi:hypothetical protein
MKEKTMPSKKRKLYVPVLLILAVLLLVYFFADFNIYGVICIANHTYDTPNEAFVRQFEADAANMGVDANTPVYIWKADESNAICCFLTAQGIVTERMFVKNGRYFATGWTGGYAYGTDSVMDGELTFQSLKRIKSSGLYSGEIQFALFCGEDKPPEGIVVLSFPAEGETYSIVTP